LIAALALGAAILTGLAGCGQSAAVRVGQTTIGRAAVAHWTSVLAPEHLVPKPPGYSACVAREQLLGSTSGRAAQLRSCHQQYDSLRQRALELLIGSAWVAATAAQDGLSVSDGEVSRRLREDGAPPAAEGGDAEDQRLAVRTELAEAKLRERLERREPAVSAAQVAAYYRTHRGRYLIPARRYILIDNLKTRAAAARVRREVAAGRTAGFVADALREHVEQPSGSASEGAEGAVRRAIFAARPNVLIGPLATGEYSLVEVKRIVAGRYEPLAKVRAAIAGQLSSERRRLTLSRFIAAWRKHWLAVTDCAPGYVVQRCRQYHGPLTPEDRLAFTDFQL
jgi:hypothetical protein